MQSNGASLPQGLDHRLVDLKSDLAACEANIAALESELFAKDSMVTRLEAELASKDSIVTEQGHMLAKNMNEYAEQVRSINNVFLKWCFSRKKHIMYLF